MQMSFQVDYKVDKCVESILRASMGFHHCEQREQASERCRHRSYFSSSSIHIQKGKVSQGNLSFTNLT